MNYTNISIILDNKHSKDTETSSYTMANANFCGKTIEVTLDKDFEVAHNSVRNVVRDYVCEVMISASKSGSHISIEEMGENYAIYSVMFYDDYNECNQTVRYIAIADVDTLGVFSAYLPE